MTPGYTPGLSTDVQAGYDGRRHGERGCSCVSGRAGGFTFGATDSIGGVGES